MHCRRSSEVDSVSVAGHRAEPCVFSGRFKQTLGWVLERVPCRVLQGCQHPTFLFDQQTAVVNSIDLCPTVSEGERAGGGLFDPLRLLGEHEFGLGLTCFHLLNNILPCWFQFPREL